MRRRPARVVRETTSAAVVLDASVAVAWFAAEPRSPEALRLLEGPWRFVAPDYMAVEAANAWWKKARDGFLRPPDVLEAVGRLSAVGVDWIRGDTILPRATRLALELRHPVYDCLYLALAHERSLPLATLDGDVSDMATALGIRLSLPKGKQAKR